MQQRRQIILRFVLKQMKCHIYLSDNCITLFVNRHPSVGVVLFFFKPLLLLLRLLFPLYFYFLFRLQLPLRGLRAVKTQQRDSAAI